MKWLFAQTDELNDEQYDQIYNSLSQSRKAHIDRMKREQDRKNSLLAVWLVNRLASMVGKENIVLENDSNGRPFLSEENLFVSISHSEKAVCCVISESTVGIDIEKIKPVKQSLIDYVCTDAEKEYVDHNESLRESRFFEVWTAKEAYFKKFGGGIKNMLSVNILPLKRQIYTINDYVITIIV